MPDDRYRSRFLLIGARRRGDGLALTTPGLAALNLAGFHALGAYIDLFSAALHYRGDLLNVWSKHTIGHTM